MRRVVTKAVVLSRTNYGEADRIVNALTADRGVIAVIAKGSRRLKSKLAGGIEPFSEVELTYTPGKGDIGTLVSSKMLCSFSNIVKEIERSQSAFTCLKWLKDNLEDESEQAYYYILLDTMRLLNNLKVNYKLAELYFYLNVLKQEGQAPDPFNGSDDQALKAADKYIFDHDGSYFVAESKGLYTSNDIKLLRVLLIGQVEVAERLVVSEDRLMAMSGLLKKHILAKS